MALDGILTCHETPGGSRRWALDGRLLSADFHLPGFLSRPRDDALAWLAACRSIEPAPEGPPLAPIGPLHEVWAAGVTWLRSREARRVESSAGAALYDLVYEAARPELFLKALGRRVRGPGAPIRIRSDARWSVPEPELTVVANRDLEILAFCAGNDVSSRDIEGENALYLPQAKIYEGSCALGPALRLCRPEDLRDLQVRLRIERAGQPVFEEQTRTTRMKRRAEDLLSWLGRELTFPDGVFLMTGTGIVPPDTFTLEPGDHVTITVADLHLYNPVDQRRTV